MYINLYQHLVGDKNKNNGLETQFLVDTGATCSLLNYDTYLEYAKIQKLTLTKAQSKTFAVNGQKLKFLGYKNFNASFDSKGDYFVKIRAWVAAKDGCKLNILGMDFLSNSTKSIDFSTPKLELKMYPGVLIAISNIKSKSYPFISSYQNVLLDQTITLAPKSTRVISISPADKVFKKGTSFKLDEDLQQKGIYTYNTYCNHDEKTLPIMLNNPKESKVIISKGSIGQIFEDIETDSKTIYSVADNIAFMEVLFNKNEHLDHIFHVSEQSKDQLFLKNSSISENHKNSKKKNKELLKQKELDYTNKYELETDFSKELKDLKPKSELNSQTHFTNIKIHEIQKKFDKTKEEFLKKCDFTHSDIDQNQLQDLMNVLLQNKNVYSQHKYDVGLIKRKFHVKLLPNSVLTKQRPSRVSLHYEEKLNDLLDQLCKSGIIREMGSNTEMGSEFINPIIILPKGNIVKLFIDARYLNSITDLSRYSWPLEPIGSLITKLKGNFFTTSDLCSAYNQVPLTEETQQLTSFVIGSKQYTFKQVFTDYVVYQISSVE